MTHRCWHPGSTARRLLRCILGLLVGATALLSAGAPALPQSLTPPSGADQPDLVANGSAHLVGGVIRLTDGPWQAGSVFTAEPIDIRSFRTTFTCRITPIPGFPYPPGDGLTFTLQGAGPNVLGGMGGHLGYTGIGQSLAVKLDTWQNGPDPSWDSTGVFFDGQQPMGGQPLPDGIGLNVGHVIQVEIAYDGVSSLAVAIGDLDTGQVWSNLYGGIDLPALVGGTSAYAGFTSGTAVSYAVHEVLAWQNGDVQNQAPVARAGQDRAAEMESPAGATVTLDGSASADPDGDTLTYAWDLDGDGGADADTPTCRTLYGRGDHTATLTVTDTRGATATDTVTIRVADTTPPTIGSVAASPSVLWPADGRMVDVALTVSASDRGDTAPVSRIVGVTCGEAASAGDWEITGDLTLKLRARRAGGSGGRTYAIRVQCADASGNKAEATVNVVVPHDRGKG